MDWVTGADVARRLETMGRTAIDGDRLDPSAAAACQLVRARRWRSTDQELAMDPAVTEGTLRWACLMFQAPTVPTGFGNYDAPGPDAVYDTISDVYRLVGYDPVIA